MKKILKKLHIYYILYKFYIPVKKFKNKNRYKLHYDNLCKDLKNNLDSKKIIYVGVPYHNNLGDQAQYYCIKRFLSKYYPEYNVIEVIDDIVFMNYNKTIELLKKSVSPEDLFVFQSGYRTTDVANFGGEYAHQAILNNFKNKVIVFPQTVNFENNGEIKKSSLAYKNNSNYVFMARDNVSYETAIKMYDKERVLLYPDIVTSLIGNYLEYNAERDGILLCLRNDAEKLYSNEMYSSLINKLKTISNSIDVTDTNSSEDFEFNKAIVESEIKKKLEMFSKYKLIITDRYHGTIFSLIANTYVIVLNSTDHKLSSGVTWFDGKYDDYVTYCDDFNKIFDIANEMYNKNNMKIDKAIFSTDYYDRLKDKIDEII